MKASIRKFLSLSIPLLIGLGIIYYQFTTLSPDELEKIKELSLSKKVQYNNQELLGNNILEKYIGNFKIK